MGRPPRMHRYCVAVHVVRFIDGAGIKARKKEKCTEHSPIGCHTALDLLNVACSLHVQAVAGLGHGPRKGTSLLGKETIAYTLVLQARPFLIQNSVYLIATESLYTCIAPPPNLLHPIRSNHSSSSSSSSTNGSRNKMVQG